MRLDPALPVLSYDEAELVAADLARCWVGMMGIPSVPSIETLADLVQRVQRKAREVITAREDGICIWFGAPLDPVTGEELDRSPRWQAEANEQYVEIDDVWPDCAADPITEEQYRFYASRQRWAERNAPDSSFANPRKRHDPLTTLLPF